MSDWLLWGWITFGALQGADVAATEMALRRPGVVEVNPLMRGPLWKRVVIKGAGTAGVVLMTKKLRDSGHPKIATALTWSANGFYAGVVIHNVGVGR